MVCSWVDGPREFSTSGVAPCCEWVNASFDIVEHATTTSTSVDCAYAATVWNSLRWITYCQTRRSSRVAEVAVLGVRRSRRVRQSHGTDTALRQLNSPHPTRETPVPDRSV